MDKKTVAASGSLAEAAYLARKMPPDTPSYGGIAAAAPVAAVKASVLDFEGTAPDGNNVLSSYAGLSWINMGSITRTWLDGNGFADSGLANGIVSEETVAYGFNDKLSEITSGGANFSFNSAYITAGFRDGLRILINAYDDGVLEYTRTIRVDDDAARLFNFNFTDVDRVTFRATGGVNDFPALDGSFFALEDAKITSGPGTITGTIFKDLDRDGIQDAGEIGLSGRRVFIDANHNGLLDTGERRVTTDANGAYTFKNVPFGVYDVVSLPPAGWEGTSDELKLFGYKQVDATYRWIDIAEPGYAMVLSDTDDGSAFLELGSPIKFYGRNYSELYISSNGFLTFGTSETDEFANQALPDSDLPNAVIAPFWDDLIVNGGVYAFEDTANGRLIVEWEDVTRYNDTSGESATFQAIIGYDGTVKFQYLSVLSVASATVGVEDARGRSGVQVDAGGVPDAGTAVTLKPTLYTYPGQTVTVDSGATVEVDFGQAKVPAPPAPAAFAPIDAIVPHAPAHPDFGHVMLV